MCLYSASSSAPVFENQNLPLDVSLNFQRFRSRVLREVLYRAKTRVEHLGRGGLASLRLVYFSYWLPANLEHFVSQPLQCVYWWEKHSQVIKMGCGSLFAKSWCHVLGKFCYFGPLGFWSTLSLMWWQWVVRKMHFVREKLGCYSAISSPRTQLLNL